MFGWWGRHVGPSFGAQAALHLPLSLPLPFSTCKSPRTDRWPTMTNDVYDPSSPTDCEAAAAARKPGNNIVQGASAASVRAIGTQLIAFYFRAPVKAFFRMRVDYMVLFFYLRTY